MLLRLLSLGLLTFSLAPAPLLPGPNLAQATAEAEVIVVASTRQGTIRALGNQVSSELVLHVERVLKGSLVSGTDIPAALEGRGMYDIPSATATKAPQLHGIWFLKPDGARYAIVPRAPEMGELWAAVVVLPEDAPAGAPNTDAAEAVGNEVVAALRWLTENHGDELTPRVLEQAIEDRKTPHFVFGKYGSEAHRLTEDLDSLGHGTRLVLYRQLAREKSPHLRAIGIAGLISANDPEGPKRAASELGDLAGSAFVQPIVQSLSAYWDDSDPDAVRAIASLAMQNPPMPRLKENASYALRVLHTKDAAPVLIALLDSEESTVRANALAGICLFVRNAPTVTPDAVRTMSWMTSRPPAPFRNADTDQFCWMGGMPEEAARLTDHVAFWKAWWQDHQTAVMRE